MKALPSKVKNCRSSSLTVRKGEEGDCRLLCTTCVMAESPFDAAFCCWRMEPLVLILWAKRQVSEIIANGGLSWLCGFEMRFGRTERREAQKGINLYYTKMTSPLAASLHNGRRRNIHSRFANGKNILPPPVRNSKCTDSSITIRPKKIGGNFVEVAHTQMQKIPQSFQEKKSTCLGERGWRGSMRYYYCLA